jgi:hypothetical protein
MIFGKFEGFAQKGDNNRRRASYKRPNETDTSENNKIKSAKAEKQA